MQQTARARYEALKPRREQFLTRARRCAELSLPSLLPPDGYTGIGRVRLIDPYQGVGARGVVSLSSRLLISLLPPGQKFFRLRVPPETLVQAGEVEEDPSITSSLAQVETMVQAEIERKAWRQPTNLALQLLVATGNAVEYLGPDNRLRVFRLDQYVVIRDSAGNVIELVIEQRLHPSQLPPEALKLTSVRAEDPEAEVPLYTWVKRIDGQYAVKQEIEEKTIPGSEGVSERNPFNVLRWNAVPGESYGRGKIEEHLPDLMALERLTQSVIEGAEMAAKNVLRVSGNAPNAKQLERKVRKLKNGDIIIAEQGEVEMMQFANVGGLSVVSNEIARLEQNLTRAFLMASSIQRDAERVTAYEVSLMAEELEGTLGGVYSMLADEMQRDRITTLIENMQGVGSLPAFDEQMASPVITTGLEALGRSQDVAKVMQAFQIAPNLPPPATEEWDFNYLGRVLMNGLDLPGGVLSEEAAAQKRQEREIQAAAMSGGGQPPM